MPTHKDHTLRISVIVAGAVREEAAKTDALGTATSVVIKPGHIRHSNLFGPAGAEMISILIPQELVSEMFRSSVWQWYHGGPVALAAARLIQSFGSANNEYTHALEEDIFVLLGTLSQALGRGHDPKTSTPWLPQVRDQLHQEYEQPYSVSQLAQDVGVHPVHLTRVFRHHYGCSITDYVRRRRVHAAAHRLATTDETLCRLALDTGFSDQSQMCRLFKREIGQTPGQFRQTVRSCRKRSRGKRV